MHRKWAKTAVWCVAVLAAGCGRGMPAPADPVTARSALRAALDAWQKGEPADSLQSCRPPTYVIDQEWRSGGRLLGYQVQSDDPAGADLRCRVVLSLADGRGGSYSKTAFYDVGTSPALTVAREEDP